MLVFRHSFTKHIKSRSLQTIITQFSNPYRNLFQEQIKTQQNISICMNFASNMMNVSLQTKLVHCFSSNQKPQKTSIYLIRHACEQLLKINPLLLDQHCIIFGKYYVLKDKSANYDKSTQNEQLIITHFKKPQLKGEGTSEVKEQQLFKCLKLIYQFLNGSKVGFLRGDLHSLTFFELKKDIDVKIQMMESIQKKQEIQFQQNDFKKLLKLVTDSTHFRLPKKGIYNRQLQSQLNLYQRQLLLQQVSNEQSHDKFQQILQSLMKLNKVQEAQVVRKFIIEWLVPLTVAIKEEQRKCMGKDLNAHRRIYAEYFNKIEAQKMATVALTQLIISSFQQIYKQGSMDVFQIQQYEGIDAKKYVAQVMKKIEAQIAYERQQKLFKETQKQYDHLLKSQNKTKQAQNNQTQNQNMDITQGEKSQKPKQQQGRWRNWKSQAFKLKQKNSPYKYVHPLVRKQFLQSLLKKISRFKSKSEIPENAQTEIGHVIIYLLKQLLKIDNKYGYKVPLLISQHKVFRKNDQLASQSILRLNQHFLSTLIPKLQKSEDMFIHMQRSVPTIVPPLPWLEPEIGGYYSQATSVMRYSNCPVQERLMKFADNHRIYEVLNYLSTIPWKINPQVLKIVEQVWAEGGQQNCIPKRYSQLINTYATQLKIETDPIKRKQLNRKLQQLRDEHSLRGDFNLKLNIARSFSQLDQFFFPHNLDFRGRVYPIPPHLNHIGNDIVRGLLLFGQGKKLGKSGLKWLKIHTANLMGNDKAPIDDKITFTEMNIEKIHRIAKDPLVHRQWLKLQDSWQAIASIIDLSTALKSPNPEEYVSYLHIHQDGSCNGLQHYAALGRDIEGAYQVNLGPGLKPSDIYTHVSKMVIKMIEQDLQGEQAPHHSLAKKLPDNIKRKTIKQTVMTSVYGVTFVGAREQIYRQLRDQNFLTEEETYAASLYVAKLTLNAISNLFTGAHQIKRWFKKCANLVSKTGNPVGWISPMGLPIVQPYRKQSRLDIINTIGHKMHVPKQVENVPINVMKQTSAFPPNYVHSLDSTHMMYTAEVCRERNLTFAAVHDSYWTHAASVDQMNEILREQFIKLHSEPLLETFKTSLENRFPEIQFPEIPIRGEFDLQKIKESIYFFS